MVGENYNGNRSFPPMLIRICKAEGEYVTDHHLMFLPFHASEDAETIDGIVRNDPNEIQSMHPVTSEVLFSVH